MPAQRQQGSDLPAPKTGEAWNRLSFGAIRFLRRHAEFLQRVVESIGCLPLSFRVAGFAQNFQSSDRFIEGRAAQTGLVGFGLGNSDVLTAWPRHALGPGRPFFPHDPVSLSQL
jgi:hypothetical protein